ncbi:MAG: DUF721 domain-containing protein [Planctomycetota bacterium]|nr:MAG: DUF721 domain-containing protein [Planctomycetota bacterium]
MSNRYLRKSQAQPLRELLSSFLHRRGLARGAEHRLVFEAWRRVVPPGIERKTRPVSFRGGRLLVIVDSASLLSELQGFRRQEFLRLLNQNLIHSRQKGLPGQSQTLIQVRTVEFRGS